MLKLPDHGWCRAVFTLSLLGASLMVQAASLYAPVTRWQADTGQFVQLDQWRGKPVLMTMAYSTCRRICQVTLKKLEQLQVELDARQREVEVVIVSYDPLNDTAQTWAEYRKQHRLGRKNWHFLSGSEQDTRQLARWLGLGDYWADQGHVMHDFKISLLDGNGAIIRQLDWQDLHVNKLF